MFALAKTRIASRFVVPLAIALACSSVDLAQVAGVPGPTLPVPNKPTSRTTLR